MAIQEQQTATEDVDQAILMLLGHRYGDGLVYLRNDSEEQWYHEAVRLGLVRAWRRCSPMIIWRPNICLNDAKCDLSYAKH